MYLHSRVIHIYSRSNFLYEKILRTTCEERRKEKVIENGKSRFRLLYIFFFSVIFSFISSLPLSFFLSYSMLCLFEHQAWTLLCIDATFSPPPSQRDPSNEDNRNEKTVKKGKKIKVMKQADKKKKEKSTIGKQNRNEAMVLRHNTNVYDFSTWKYYIL